MDNATPNLDVARRALTVEHQAVGRLAETIDESFADACRAICACTGKVVLTGIGKAGVIARKISATLASTGTQSIFLHPVEALHGDLGRLQRGDVVLALSHSGASEEIVRLLDHIKARGATLVALTSEAKSPLGSHAEITLCYGQIEEACPMQLAPTASTTCMLVLGDALALTVMDMREFGPEEFAEHHPGGSLGRQLIRVRDAIVFKAGERLTLAGEHLSLGDALEEAQRGDVRRSGAMLLVDGEGRLSGILTDADLRRSILAHRGEDIMSRPVRDFMTADPKAVGQDELASTALAIMNEHRLDELPVLDGDGRPVGVIDVQDLLGLKTLGGSH
jgi:arabinose-5-phosphate isomerase